MESTKKRMPNAVWCLLLFFLCLFLNVGCSDDSTTSEIPSDWISDLPSTIEFNVTGGSKEIPLTWSEGVNAAHVACILSEENRQWCDAKLENNTLVVSVSPSAFTRSAAITLVYDKEHKSVVYVNQKSDFSAYFADESCSELRQGITDAEIEKIPHETMRELARELKAGRYDTEFRVADYRPYQHPSVMAVTNKTVNEHMLKRYFTCVFKCREHHSHYPERNYIVTRYKHACRIEVIKFFCLIRPAKC